MRTILIHTTTVSIGEESQLIVTAKEEAMLDILCIQCTLIEEGFAIPSVAEALRS